MVTVQRKVECQESKNDEWGSPVSTLILET